MGLKLRNNFKNLNANLKAIQAHDFNKNRNYECGVYNGMVMQIANDQLKEFILREKFKVDQEFTIPNYERDSVVLDNKYFYMHDCDEDIDLRQKIVSVTKFIIDKDHAQVGIMQWDVNINNEVVQQFGLNLNVNEIINMELIEADNKSDKSIGCLGTLATFGAVAFFFFLFSVVLAFLVAFIGLIVSVVMLVKGTVDKDAEGSMKIRMNTVNQSNLVREINVVRTCYIKDQQYVKAKTTAENVIRTITDLRVQHMH